MTHQQSINRATSLLQEARRHRTPVAPISISCDIKDLSSAYQISEQLHLARIADGARMVGKKIGLTSAAVQQQLGVNEPDFGFLYDDMGFSCGSELPGSRLIQPKIEAEVAFVISKPLAIENPTYAEFLDCVEYALPALEIVDSAIEDWKISLVDTVADNASSGLFVLGDQPVSIGSLQLGELKMSMTRDDAVVSTGTGAACMGHPLRAAYWLARLMSSKGQGLQAGEIILSGALGPMVPFTAGSRYEAEIGALGTVSCSLA